MKTLFEKVNVGGNELTNRIVMAPMTRNRADENGDPNDLMVEYYKQRTSFGLIITEGTAPAHVGKAYPAIPGIYTDSQVAGWKKITDAVHASGSRIFMQLMHSGRISHTKITGLDPMSASAVKPAGELFTGSGMDQFEAPKEMTLQDIAETKAAFVSAAKNAIAAGFDGVELHGANGYLLHQFLAPNSNIRTDEYGGTPEKRCKFVLEVLTAVVEAIGANKTAIRISPNGTFNDIAETDTEEMYSYLINSINELGLAFLHVSDQPGFDSITFARKLYKGCIVANSGYADKTKVETSKRIIETGQADLFSFGRLALANPDLPKRLELGLELNSGDPKTFYSRGPIGYTDYPVAP
jgi:N-ethylmaleimide reductase